MTTLAKNATTTLKDADINNADLNKADRYKLWVWVLVVGLGLGVSVLSWGAAATDATNQVAMQSHSGGGDSLNIAGTAASATVLPADALAWLVRVNGVGISVDNIERGVRGLLRQRQLDSRYLMPGSPQYRGIRQEVLNELIGQELLWQDAKQRNLVVSGEEVERTLSAYVQQFPDRQAFVSQLQQDGLTEQAYIDNLKQRLSVQQMIETEVLGQIQVSDEEVHQYYQANASRLIQPEQVRVRHILFKVSADTDAQTRQQIHVQARALLDLARSGADFAELAREHSQGPSAANGGDLGYVVRGQLETNFDKAAFELGVNEISDLVETRFGIHLIKLEERLAEHQLTEEEAREPIKRQLYAAKVKSALENRVQALWSKGRIELLAPL